MIKINEGKYMKHEPKPRQKSAVEENMCSLCRAVGNPPPCKGHGGGGGGGGSSGSSSKDNKNLMNIPTTSKTLPVNNQVAFDWLELLKPRAGNIQFESGLLQISSDNLHGILILLKLRDMIEKDIKASNLLFDKIESEFGKFKKNLEKEGISTDGFKVERKENGLMIKISQPNYYEAYILQLVNKNLLCSPKASNKNLADDLDKDIKKKFLNPFSTKLERK